MTSMEYKRRQYRRLRQDSAVVAHVAGRRIEWPPHAVRRVKPSLLSRVRAAFAALRCA